jgi:type 2 lantibiotic biosynthesis protein LanM
MDLTDFQGAAWYHALPLTERIALRAGGEAARNGAAASAERRLQRWRSQAAFAAGLPFSRRLAQDGITEEDLLHLLGEPVESLRDRSPAPPAWLDELARAFVGHALPAAEGPHAAEQRPGQELLGFLAAAEPLVSRGRGRLRDGIADLARTYADLPFDPGTVEGVLLANLPAVLLPMLARTLVLELNAARLQGLLPGDTPEARFRAFLERLRRRETVLALYQEYPVLARQLALRMTTWVAFHLEFLRNLCADWEALRAAFGPEGPPGPLAEVTGGAGDPHRGGRAVLIARFRSGLCVVYKPKSLAVDVRFQQLLAWLNERGASPPFRTLKVLDCGDHGWVEFVAADGCVGADEVRRFYERQGGYLALLYALEATDFHAENLIAAGEHPVLIDLEALFHPRAAIPAGDGADGRAGSALAYSVLRVGLLPQRLWADEESEGLDISGLGAAPGQLTPRPVPAWDGAGTDEMRLSRKRMPFPGSQNRPRLDGAAVDVARYTGAIASGFVATYRLLLRHRDELLSDDGPLARFAGDEVRVLLRGTDTYAQLLHGGFHPDLLRDALDRDRFLDRLWAEAEQRPFLARAIAAERAALDQGDIPMFTTRPDCRDLWGGAGERISDFFEECGLDLVRGRLRRLSEDDLARQLWFVRASLATLSLGAEPAAPPTPRAAAAPVPADRARLLAAARAVGDRLEALALREGDDATWIGLTMVRDRQWSLMPLGADLYGGLAGVALFLAYLGDLSGEERYTALARGALGTLRGQVRWAASRFSSVGAFDGWGGVIYALAHLAALWQRPDLLDEAMDLVGRLPDLVGRDEQLDVMAGSAGCLGALLALEQFAPSRRVREVAARCGDRLVASARPAGQGLGWTTRLPSVGPLTGFSHGAAGMAWALLGLAARTGREHYRRAALAAIAYERGLFADEPGNWPDLRAAGPAGFVTAWCHGAPGIGLARLGTLGHLDDGQVRAEIGAALRTTLRCGFGANHSLCHGDLGNLELLLQAAEVLHEPHWRGEAGRVGAAVLGGIAQGGWLCGVPGGVESPGLMTGLAGIGYGLLRLAAPECVPCVLLLEPPRPRRARSGVSGR